MEEVVLKCWLTETKKAWSLSRVSIILYKSIRGRVREVYSVVDYSINLIIAYIMIKFLEGRSF